MSKLDENYTRLSNDILESLARVNLSAYEWRVLMVIFRKTYGYQKKQDWIALSQIVSATGMHKAHVSRAKRKLIERRIVTQTGNNISFNKYHSQWSKLPIEVTVTSLGKAVAYSGNSRLPIQAYTKETLTKETIQKTERKKKIIKWFEEQGITKPHSYLLKIQKTCSDEAIRKAWNDANRGSGVESAPAFFGRCEYYSKQEALKSKPKKEESN